MRCDMLLCRRFSWLNAFVESKEVGWLASNTVSDIRRRFSGSKLRRSNFWKTVAPRECCDDDVSCTRCVFVSVR